MAMFVVVVMKDDNDNEEEQIVDGKLLVALKRFERDDDNNDESSSSSCSLLWMHNVNFNRASLYRLVAFLHSGRNRHSNRSVQHLNLSTCRFDDEALHIFCT